MHKDSQNLKFNPKCDIALNICVKRPHIYKNHSRVHGSGISRKIGLSPRASFDKSCNYFRYRIYLAYFHTKKDYVHNTVYTSVYLS